MNTIKLDLPPSLLQTLQTLSLPQQQELLKFLESNINPPSKKEEVISTGRIAGLYQGQGWISEDFNEPLTDDFLLET